MTKIILTLIALLSFLFLLVKWGESRNESKHIEAEKNSIIKEQDHVIETIKVQKKLSQRVRENDSADARRKWMQIYFDKTSANK